ncbi:MAG: glycosyltransferase family 39 protein [Deltaproteobacteria bacterium]|nr:glycosyltransferase family 39 protein [Deltaproteobacteria bacterium]
MRGSYSVLRGITLAIVVLLMFCLVINSSWKAIPDGALYLELGESIARGRGYMFNGERHTYVPPGYPMVVAGMVAVVGKSFLAYRILMACIGLLTAAAGYLLILRLCGRDTAFLAGGLFALNHVLLYNSTFTSSDVPFALAVLLALHAVISLPRVKRIFLWSVLAGIIAGLPALIRVNGWGVPPAIAFFLFTATRGQSIAKRLGTVLLLIVSSVLPAGSWEMYKSSFPVSFQEGTYLNAVTGRTFKTQADIVLRAAWDYMHETTYALSSLSIKTCVLELVIPCFVIVGLVAAIRKNERLLAPLTVIQFGGLLLSPAGSRYIVALIPGLYLFFALGVLRVSDWARERFSKRNLEFLRPQLLLPLMFAILAGLNCAHNMVTIIQARTALESNGAESLRDLPFFTAGRWLRDNAGNGAVLTMHPRVIHYLSGLPTVELVRSGVPEHLVWIDVAEQIEPLIALRGPTYFFSDADQASLYNETLEALKVLGLTVENVDRTASSQRFRLWRIVKMQ